MRISFINLVALLLQDVSVFACKFYTESLKMGVLKISLLVSTIVLLFGFINQSEGVSLNKDLTLTRSQKDTLDKVKQKNMG
jgi:hypothetical protein